MSKLGLIRRATALTTAAANTAALFGEAQMAVAVVSPSTEEDSANVVTQNFAGILTGPIDFVMVFIQNSAGVHRTAGTVTFSGTTVTVTEANLATTDRVVIKAFTSPLF